MLLHRVGECVPLVDDNAFDNIMMNRCEAHLPVTSYTAPRIGILDVIDGDSGWDNHNGVADVS